ncbi:MAG: hypothetical protein IPG94_18595 [Kineosporiaceae bacterium]|nr:hypothetical protein [Kineosporiaceae bacterium]
MAMQGELSRWATVRLVGAGQPQRLQLGRGLTFGRGGARHPVDVTLSDLETLSRRAVEITLHPDAVWVHAHQRRGGVVEVLLPGGHLLASLRQGNEIPVHEVVFRVRIRVDRGVFDLHVVQNVIPQNPIVTGSTQSTHDAWRPAVLLTEVPGEDWRRVLALACAMTVYPRGVGTVVDLPAAQEVEASAHEWDAQVPAFKQVLTVCGNLFGGKRSGKWLSDRLDKALAAFGEPADHRDKLVRLVPLVLRTGLIDDATMLALAHQIDGLPPPAHVSLFAHDSSGAVKGDRPS